MLDPTSFLKTAPKQDDEPQYLVQRKQSIGSMAGFKSNICEAVARHRLGYRPSQLEADLYAAIYGSNMIASAGTSYDHTALICLEVLRGAPVLAPITDPDHDPDYAPHVHFLIDCGKRATFRAVAASRLEVIRHAHAFCYLMDRVLLKGRAVSEAVLCETHRRLVGCESGVDGGEYRGYEGGGRAMLSMRWRAVKHRMVQFCEELAKELEEGGDVDAYALAARYHHHLMCIRPFVKGNGRLARMLVNVLLLRLVGRISVIGMNGDEVDEYRKLAVEGRKAFQREGFEMPRGARTSHLELANFLYKNAMN
ncbi:hypothetical protein MY3296_000214 [Beauveria thailandica]